MQKAIFGAGCFWGVEEAFARTAGVLSTKVGYSGGSLQDPTYEDVCSGRTGHAEVVLVEFDPEKLSYEGLLEVFWANHDPTTMNRQGPDHGTQYRSAIFYTSPEQEVIAKQSKERLNTSGKLKSPVVTLIEPAKPFYPAEEYHQKYLQKRGLNVCH
jgi:peptide-methionine (S)-S-oxide reductase